MRIPYKKLLEKLGVHRELRAYETNPWMHYDDEKGITCSAEVRISAGQAEAQAEIQFLYDDPQAAEKSNPEQIMLMRMIPLSGELWGPHTLSVKGKDLVNQIGGWEEKGCNFFRACIQSIQMGELPDIEELQKKELPDDDGASGGRGRIGRKSPKIKPENVLGMKKGM